MQPHQERVVKEEADLAEKVLKLSLFIGGPVFSTLSVEERIRLSKQLEYMHGYLRILRDRIAAFPAEPAKMEPPKPPLKTEVK